MITETVRVGTSTNFNCTKKEWDQLDNFAQTHPTKAFFINSNIRTPKLPTTINHPYKIVITANPDLAPSDILQVLEKLEGIRSHIAFVRVKYLPDNKPIMNLLKILMLKKYPIVLTLQRFNSKDSLAKFTDISFYKYSCSRYRLAGPELDKIVSFVTEQRAAGMPIWICDQAGTGCQGCGLCSRLTTGEDHTVTSLNLSSSGTCPFSCPDCYAKTMQRFALACGHRAMDFDRIYRNDKQAGRTEHIKRNLVSHSN